MSAPGSEFDVINRYFNRPALTAAGNSSDHLILGPGDDCAILAPSPGKQLAFSMDVLVPDVHFPAQADPTMLAQRCLRVNLSDLAAMGAEPAAFTLGLVLPSIDEKWLDGFSHGLAEVAGNFSCPLAGGDLSSGPLSITIQVHGWVDPDKILLRSSASVGDRLYVSGELGAAGLALKMLMGEGDFSAADVIKLNLAFYLPEPQLELATACKDYISSAIDISDGLLADTGHIATASNVGIEINVMNVPAAQVMENYLDHADRISMALTAGDDYQLAMTVPEDKALEFEKVVFELGKMVTCIGRVVEGSGVNCLDVNGDRLDITQKGYQHFMQTTGEKDD